jgi:hypothetical protein
MARWKQRQMKYLAAMLKRAGLIEFEDVFTTRSGHPGLHQAGGRRAQDDLPMRGNVVGMRVADKHPLRPDLWFLRVEPQAQVWQT